VADALERCGVERMSLFLGTDSELVARMSEQVFANGVSDPGYAKLVVSAPLVRPAPTIGQLSGVAFLLHN
jgi:hypothetical protein